MNLSADSIIEAAMLLPEDERATIALRLLETMPDEDVTLSIDDPTLVEELDRRFADGAKLIPWSELRAED
jgi:hypothetical protein